ncbi:MAG TPA: nickel-dependent lactate racemase [Chloroflexota bacterium]|nr:nickel-dependent lactate racemase [Chloroflexota bacterium]
MQVTFPYPNIAPVDVPDANLLGVFAPKSVPTSATVEQLVADALSQPIGAPRLRDQVDARTRVLILVDDTTRPTPAASIVPVVLDELKAGGVPRGNVSFLTADGTHGCMTQAQLEHKLGADVLNHFPVYCHRWREESQMVDLGKTALEEVPVIVDRRLTEADVIVSIGHIVPHRITGFSGGAKSIVPGVAGMSSDAKEVHWLAAQYPARDITGVADNPMRRIVNQAGQMARLRFIVNVIQDNHERVIRVVAGDPDAAHRDGCSTSRDIYGVRIPELAPIVLLDSFPSDVDYWQAAKAAYAAELAVQHGGVLILVTPCPEGVAREHPELLQLGVRPLDEIRRMVARGVYQDVVAAAIAALTAWVVRERAHGIMVSPGIPADERRAIGFEPAATAQEALAMALKRCGAAAKVLVLQHGGEILPMPPGSPAAKGLPG